MAFNLDTLRSNIRAERARCNISQEELAHRCGVSTAAILSYESGIYVPGTDKLAAIAEALGVTPNDLLGWPD